MMYIRKNFLISEVACRHCGKLLVNDHALDLLQRLREEVGPLFIHSAYRCPVHNALVGGAPLSQHKFGRAFDIGLRDYSKITLHYAAKEVGFTGFGLNYKTFIHVDTGPKRSW